MSLLKRYIPPVGMPVILSLKAIAIGVGSVGMAGRRPFISLALNCKLNGVFGERSVPSSMLETERFRLFMFFRLEDEKFFRIPDLDWARPGEPERGRSLSLVRV